MTLIMKDYLDAEIRNNPDDTITETRRYRPYEVECNEQYYFYAQKLCECANLIANWKPADGDAFDKLIEVRDLINQYTTRRYIDD